MPTPKRDVERAQYEQDIEDVFVLGIKKPSDFEEPYRQLIIDGYRFSATKFGSNEETNVPTIPETLDII